MQLITRGVFFPFCLAGPLYADVLHPVDAAVGVVRDEEGAVVEGGDAHRAAPCGGARGVRQEALCSLVRS